MFSYNLSNEQHLNALFFNTESLLGNKYHCWYFYLFILGVGSIIMLLNWKHNFQWNRTVESGGTIDRQIYNIGYKLNLSWTECHKGEKTPPLTYSLKGGKLCLKLYVQKHRNEIHASTP